MREIRRPAALLAVGAAMALPLAACGDDDEDDSGEETAAATTEATTEATGTTAPTGKARTISVSETDFALAPKDLTVKAGTAVTFDVRNDGATDHSLEVEGPEGEAELEQDLAPGGRGSLEVSFSKPGTYEWYCPVGNHKDMGMEGTITVN